MSFIGLVLPVETLFVVVELSSLSSRKANTWANYQDHARSNIVLASCLVRSMFLLIGHSASQGFLDNKSKGTRVYLEEWYLDQPWSWVVNSLVMVIVLD
jgi:hypothetical protein